MLPAYHFPLRPFIYAPRLLAPPRAPLPRPLPRPGFFVGCAGVGEAPSSSSGALPLELEAGPRALPRALDPAAPLAPAAGCCS